MLRCRWASSIFQSEFCGGSFLVYLLVCSQCLAYSACKIVFWTMIALQVIIRRPGNACGPPGLTRLQAILTWPVSGSPSVSCCFQVGIQSESSRVSEGVSSQTSSCPTPVCQCHPQPSPTGRGPDQAGAGLEICLVFLWLLGQISIGSVLQARVFGPVSRGGCPGVRSPSSFWSL